MARIKQKQFYVVPAVSRAFDILEMLRSDGQPLSLECISQRINAPKTSVYRILQTCMHRGYLAQTPEGFYRAANIAKKLRFGFAGESSDMPFSERVTQSLKSAACSSDIDLLVLDNLYDAKTAIRNVDRFVKELVDLVIEFQIEQRVAALIADKIAAARIPLIAVDVPHPHAIYFGADNYRVGFSSGEVLARHAIRKWRAKVSWVLGLDVAQGGPFVRNRTNGAFDGIRSQLPNLRAEAFVRVDSRGLREKAYRQALDFLERRPTERGILIVGHNDTVALGALRAVRELRREKQVAIVGNDCIPEAMEEMYRPRSPLVGSVSLEAEAYGANLINLGLNVLRGNAVAPYNFTPHKVMTPDLLLRTK